VDELSGVQGGPDRADAIAAGVEAIVASCREQAPEAVSILTGIVPRSEPAVAREIGRINRSLERYALEQGLRFIDINEQLGEDGLLRPEMSGDGLHLSLAGYEVWAEALKPLFTEILGSPAETDLAPPPTGNPAARPAG
jgi:lysophospholipase L1-like esterase